ncbi:hypothetical protein GGI03_001707 [Coemansia sp. RSA 2337]|nr:hypothetical protein H4S04_003353 [Coemansia sp. S16]KAJ2066487.1 hypothetical protein GGI08_001843 [Coemansia sp. S2]KAJ2074142.1 hypothetical protein GGH13_001513 [Coemansia sp. S155-1]KAJ2353503.1 hypothetical protein GGH92_000615 [Coemansia sp. RSA 2673]KAJ2431853.1 hypothetical protein GGF41_000348 [Coemansia sp. RSA 2531]KAJ2467172.1 hypothetical protein GGI03_001707 [Coemansia sp. RSA 2337]
MDNKNNIRDVPGPVQAEGQNEALELMLKILAEKSNVIAQNESKFITQEQLIAKQEKAIAEQEKTIAEQEKTITEQKQTFAKQEKSISFQQKTFHLQQQTIAKQQQTITERDKTIIEQDKTIAKQDQIINEHVRFCENVLPIVRATAAVPVTDMRVKIEKVSPPNVAQEGKDRALPNEAPESSRASKRQRTNHQGGKSGCNE